MTIQEETLHSNIETVNSKQLAILKKNFPQCFDKEGNFIQEKMLEVVNANDVELSKESYSLNWLGKSYARLLTNLPPKTLINADIEHNQLEQNKNSQNLLLKGDNLEVLKHMVNAYSEKIKMIYIDPPYNTGSDGFVYNDDRKFTKQQLSELAGIELDEAERILEFTDKGSNSHSAWLTFMYPRLYIAKELLKDDGVIFISIDDNESSQLKILCDEIFGEPNFVAQISVQLNPRGRNLDKFIAKTHESVLVFVKNYENENSILGMQKEGRMVEEYNKVDSKGQHRLTGLRNRNQSFNPRTRPKLYYPLYIDKSTGSISLELNDIYTEEVWPDTPEGIKTCWTWGQDKALKENNLLIAENTGKGWRIYRKDYLLDEGGKTATTLMKSIMLDKEINNDYGRKTIKELFGSSVMSFPKSVDLINKFVQIGSNDNDIVLDFFAGSGTTGHSVMQINAANNQTRQFINVQIDEITDKESEANKAGYKTIFDVTKDRLIKAANQIKNQYPEYIDDLGFKVYESTDDFRVVTDEELTLSQATMFDDVMLTDEQYHTLLTSWSLYDGSLLTTPIETIELDGYQAHYGDGRLYLIAENFSTNALKALLIKLDENKTFTPHKVVFYGNNFGSAKQMELNEALKSYANKKSLELEVVVRY